MKKADSPSRLIDARIKELGDWRARTLARLRKIIQQADSDVVEEWKWNVPVWSHGGIICTGETYSSLEGTTRRAIDFRQGDKINEKALKALIRAAAAFNRIHASAQSDAV